MKTIGVPVSLLAALALLGISSSVGTSASSIPDETRSAETKAPAPKPAEPKPADPKPPEPTPAEPAPEPQIIIPPDPNESVFMLSKEVFDAYVAFYPARSSEAGLRLQNDLLGDYRKSVVGGFLGSCKGWTTRLEGLASADFTDTGIVEQMALRVALRAMIRELATRAAPTKDPNFYVDESVGAIQELTELDSAAGPTRADYLKSRMKKLHGLFAQARENLGVCAKGDVQRAIDRLRSARTLFESTATQLMFEFANPQTTKEAMAVPPEAWKEVREFADWLAAQKLATAQAWAPLGAAGWKEWVRSREDMDLTPAMARAAAETDLKNLRGELRAVGSKIPGGKSTVQLLLEMMDDRPNASSARMQSEKLTAALWDWMVSDRLLTPPSDELIDYRMTPTYRRFEVPVRANFPGGYAPEGSTSFLEVGTPDPDWPIPLLNGWLTGFGRFFLPIEVAREVYPGRYVGFEAARRAKVRTGRVLPDPTMSEGWGLYAAETAIRRGAGGDDLRVRMAMLVEMIRADVRLVGSLDLHTGSVARDEVVGWMMREGFWSKEEAVFEADRLQRDPDAAAGPLGRLMILALRDDLRREKGKDFDLRAFHDRLLSFGPVPVSALRRVMLPAKPGSLLPVAPAAS